LLLQSAASVTHPDKTKYFPKAFFRVLWENSFFLCRFCNSLYIQT
jgi:hypothetical protein